MRAAPASGADPGGQLDSELGALLAAHPQVQVVHPEIHLSGDVDAAVDPATVWAAVAEPLGRAAGVRRAITPGLWDPARLEAVAPRCRGGDGRAPTRR